MNKKSGLSKVWVGRVTLSVRKFDILLIYILNLNMTKTWTEKLGAFFKRCNLCLCNTVYKYLYWWFLFGFKDKNNKRRFFYSSKSGPFLMQYDIILLQVKIYIFFLNFVRTIAVILELLSSVCLAKKGFKEDKLLLFCLVFCELNYFCLIWKQLFFQGQPLWNDYFAELTITKNYVFPFGGKEWKRPEIAERCLDVTYKCTL